MKGGWVLAGAMLLAGCAAGDWAKAGADDAAGTREYQDCRELAATATKTDADIDQDILVTRQRDWQRNNIARPGTQTMHRQTGDRAAAIIDRCMQAKGFSRAR